MKNPSHPLSRVGALALALWALGSARAETGASNAVPLPVRLTWGHTQRAAAPFHIKIVPGGAGVSVESAQGFSLEPGEGEKDGGWQTMAGNGDVDGLEFVVRYPEHGTNAPRREQSIWTELLARSDADTVRRLREDPGFQVDPPKIVVQMDAEGTRGFAFTPDQLKANQALWIPALDAYLTRADSPVAFADHQESLRAWSGCGIRELIARAPEASYQQFQSLWEDMGSPGYKNPHAQGPGHIVCLSWDSAMAKFGVDRWAGVWHDYGNPDRFRLWLEIGESGGDRSAAWKSQHLESGWPVITTVFEENGIRYEIEQFAYPLDGPPAGRRGDMPMVLLQKVKASDTARRPHPVVLGLSHARELPGQTNANIVVAEGINTWTWEVDPSRGILLALQGEGLTVESRRSVGGVWKTNAAAIRFDLPAGGAREFIIKLPSPRVAPERRDGLLGLNYAAARQATLKFWSDIEARGAGFEVPEEAVNHLYRANLWHALRLPRRHAGSAPSVEIDLPYSNFAYDQLGTPWPVNQAVYVDYMIYDLRGYHALAAEELMVMFRRNQEPNGHIKGFANWGVYTPGMLYSVANHYLLSRDRAAFETLLPPTLKALDWCLGEMERAAANPGVSAGMILAPLNDLSNESRAWAFNQAYFYAGIERLGRALADIQHPRAAVCQDAAAAFKRAIERGFGHAAMKSPLAQLRDHTWTPYVPSDALNPRRLFEIWYPTEVDTGALHLTRLKALDPQGLLATCLLNDHEDNLFAKGLGMANEPVYNQHAMTYLLRDDAKAAIRAFYSMMACAFSHSVFEPVEHRWGWGQYFGPPSTDGAWFELYRQLLIQEGDDDTLRLCQATPRRWLEDGQQIQVKRAPTFYGPLDMRVQSRAATGEIRVELGLAPGKKPAAILMRLRHPQEARIHSVRVNGRPWADFDPNQEWVRIQPPAEDRYEIVVNYR